MKELNQKGIPASTWIECLLICDVYNSSHNNKDPSNLPSAKEIDQ